MASLAVRQKCAPGSFLHNSLQNDNSLPSSFLFLCFTLFVVASHLRCKPSHRDCPPCCFSTIALAVASSILRLQAPKPPLNRHTPIHTPIRVQVFISIACYVTCSTNGPFCRIPTGGHRRISAVFSGLCYLRLPYPSRDFLHSIDSGRHSI